MGLTTTIFRGFCVATLIGAASLTAIAQEKSVPHADALKRLQEGNARFVAGKTENPRSDQTRRTEVAEGQKPFAAFVSCADSRVPVERVFDQGIGDLFVVRVAGNVCEGSEAGSIEFGVTALGARLVVVMGHTKCGAVVAASGDQPIPGAIGEVIKDIKPAVERVRKEDPKATGDSLVAKATRANVHLSIEKLLESSEALRSEVSSGNVAVVGAVYDIATGKVEWLGQHPRQAELLKGGKKDKAKDE